MSKIVFLKILGVIEVNYFAVIHLILKARSCNDSLNLIRGSNLQLTVDIIQKALSVGLDHSHLV